MRGRLKPAPGSWEQSHTEPRRGAANVEVRWNKRCVSKLAQSCRQGNRLYKSSPYLLCDFGEKEKKPESGACRRSEPSAAKSTAQSPPGHAAHTPKGACALSTVTPLDGFPGGCKKRCVQEKTQEPTNPPLQPEAPEIVVKTARAEAESARVPERAAPKHISTCGHQKKEAVTNKPCQGAREDS